MIFEQIEHFASLLEVNQFEGINPISHFICAAIILFHIRTLVRYLPISHTPSINTA